MSIVSVALSAQEASTVSVESGEIRVNVPDLGPLLDELGDSVDLIVIGSSVSEPVALVQLAHRMARVAGIVVFTSESRTAAIRNEAAYAPDVPLDLLLVRPGESAFAQICALRESVRARRSHQSLFAEVSRQVGTQQSTSEAPLLLLGPLLEQAPVGVLICDLGGSIRGWNRRGSDLLLIDESSLDVSIDVLLPGTAALVRDVLAQDGADTPGDEPPVNVTLRLDNLDLDVELTLVVSQLSDGTQALLVLLADVTAQLEAQRAQVQIASLLEALGRVSGLMSSTLDPTEALDRLVGFLTTSLTLWAAAWIYDDVGQPSAVAFRHRDGNRWTADGELDPGLGTPTVNRGRPAGPGLWHEPSNDKLAKCLAPLPGDLVDRLSAGTLIVVPLARRSGTYGTLVLGSEPTSRWTERELTVASEIGERAGASLDNARLYALQRDLATELQRSLLSRPPKSGQGTIAVRYLAAAEEAQVGGDWYDAFLEPDGSTVLVIGDASGHDTRAAAAMGQVRGVLRGIGYTTNAGPAEILERLDDAIAGLGINTLATGIVVRVESQPDPQASAALVRWSSAGHPPPFVVYPQGRVDALEVAEYADVLLGFVPGTPRTEATVELPWGSTMLLYTDGLIESRSRTIDEGLSLLRAILESHHGEPLESLCDVVLADMLRDELEDDVAMIAMRLERPRR